MQDSQREQQLLTYREVTREIEISVSPEFLEEHSSSEDDVYAFAYTVRIENFGLDTIQLLRRHWVVISGEEVLTEVKGEGVIGEQPVLEPGDCFEYTSSSIIQDPIGAMYGNYTFQNEDGDLFEVTIPEFDLMCRTTIH